MSSTPPSPAESAPTPATASPTPPVKRGGWFGRLVIVALLFYCGYLHLQMWGLKRYAADPVAMHTELHLNMHRTLHENSPASVLDRLTHLLVKDWESFVSGVASTHPDQAVWQYRIERALGSQPGMYKTLPDELRASMDRSALFPEPLPASGMPDRFSIWLSENRMPAWLNRLMYRVIPQPPGFQVGDEAALKAS